MNVHQIQAALPLSRTSKEKLNLDDTYYDEDGYLLVPSPRRARELALLYAKNFEGIAPQASDIYGAGHIVAAWRILLGLFAEDSQAYESTMIPMLEQEWGTEELHSILNQFMSDFPWHSSKEENIATKKLEETTPEKLLQKWTLTQITQDNPAFISFAEIFTNPESESTEKRNTCWLKLEEFDKQFDKREPENSTPIDTLKTPIVTHPHSVEDQLRYILTRWGYFLGEWARYLLMALDMIKEEHQARFSGPGPARGISFDDMDAMNESAQFSEDHDWMPEVVLLAKNVLVWLNQLSKTYGYTISQLNQIPDEELNVMASRGFNSLWLIGLWERSHASQVMKRKMGNPEATASAYSLYGYEISTSIGGWQALENLRNRAAMRGIRLSSDMVPNHVGIDSDWVRHHPERLLCTEQCPFPGYSFFGENISGDDSIDIRLEDHYWDKSDAAVVFQRHDKQSGETRYIYHGNDGTSMPWNDTAQINFLNADAREAVIQDILHVARNFPIIRFDAAMVLARKHIRRLWFPAPGAGGAIPSRAEHALSDKDFNAAIPMEFWREVVDRVAQDVPGTLLLAEAFWMMEGYFVRTLGMHRVYNSAFMNMLRDEKNNEYRDMIKKTLLFDPGILQRFVNFMNNPDEETAVEQFGKGDKYFAVCTLLVTLPGLPMIGHGQIEGFSEKYGMEYTKAYREENPDEELIQRHQREIFPLLAKRYIFAGASAFRIYDFQGAYGTVESVFAFSNSFNNQRALIIVNNAYERASGIIKDSVAFRVNDSIMHDNLASSLAPSSAHDSDWLLLRDQAAGLWYIRSVGELRHRGLRIMIDGFGRQTYVDIHVAPNMGDGLWNAVAKEIGSAGTADIEAILYRIRLRPITKTLNDLLPLGFIMELADTIKKGKKPLKLLDKKRMESALAKLSELGITGLPSPSDGVREIAKRLQASTRLWKSSHRRLRRKMNKKTAPADKDEAILLAIWSVFSIPVPGHWHELGMNIWFNQHLALSSYALQSHLKMLFSLAEWKKEARYPDKVLEMMMDNPEVCHVCGVNNWNGTTWYSQEGWNGFVRSIILCGVAQSVSRRFLLQILKHWREIHVASQYNWITLREEISPVFTWRGFLKRLLVLVQRILSTKIAWVFSKKSWLTNRKK